MNNKDMILDLPKSTSELLNKSSELEKYKKEVDARLKATNFERVINYLRVRIELDKDDNIIIKGIDYNLFFKRLKSVYSERTMKRMFVEQYTEWSLKRYTQKKIKKSELKIKYLFVPSFFALELSIIFMDIGNLYNISYYKKASLMIRKNTWVNKLYNPIETVPIDLSKLSNIKSKYTLKDYQKEFISAYNTLKNRYNFHGYILSFDQGLGKTLTSIALSECLNKDCIIIVCPNSLKENWSYEIKDYFDKYDNTRKWLSEVYVAGISGYKFNKNTTKYIIVNMEAIPSIYKLIDSNKNNMIIVDEMHNFRNMNGKRTNELLKLKELTNCKDCLLMSGTPIKATPNEIIPALLMIDPMFNYELAKIYDYTFKVNGTDAFEMINVRFGMYIYRKVKSEVLKLPSKFIYTLPLKVKDSYRYLSKTVNSEVYDKFEELYNKELANSKTYVNEYKIYVKKYSKASFRETNEYLKYINNPGNDYHEIDLEKFKLFHKLYIVPYIKDKEEVKKFNDLHTWVFSMYGRCMGRALGAIIPKRRSELYIELYEYNKEKIIDMIDSNLMKTVIFTPFLDVVKHIKEDLEKEEIGVVDIVGGSSDRMDKIQTFKHDDNIKVLIATVQSLSTGVTLTEANQMLFFGTPWRSADFDQACDRIHRIGQTQDVNIYKLILDTGNDLNLSTRMNDILNWSENQFDIFIDGEKRQVIKEGWEWIDDM